MALFCLHYLKKGLNIAKKIFLVFLVYFVVMSLFFYFINKNKPRIAYDPVKKNREEIYKVINDKKLNSSEEGKLTIALYRAMMCGMVGEACTSNPDDGDKNFNKSLFGFVSTLIVLPYVNPPASGLYWAYDGLQNAGLIPKTYAAEGIGFAALKPFSNIWKLFRDVSYMFVVLVLITIGFMIMFRMKLNPQTVITVENALPKIVISLLLITFSFPIAGFMIDLMYISIGVIAVFFSRLAGIPELFNTPQKILENFYFEKNIKLWNLIIPFDLAFNIVPFNADLFQLTGSIFGILPETIKNIINTITLLVFPPHKILYLITSKARAVGPEAAVRAVGHAILERFNPIEKNLERAGSGTPMLSIIIGLLLLVLDLIFFQIIYSSAGLIIIFLVLWATLIYLFLRIFFVLLYSYLQVILLIFFAPLILLAEMIPGKSTFSLWIKNLIINLSTWPILIVLLLINATLMNQSVNSTAFWQPPFLMAINNQYISVIISMGILFMIPELIKAIKDLFGVKPLPLGLNLGAFTAGAGSIIGGGAGLLSQFYTPYQFLFGADGIFRKRKLPNDAQEFYNTTATIAESPAGDPGIRPPQKG